MHRRFRSICRIGASLVLSLLCLPYSSRADNLLSGNGTLLMAFNFDSAGSTLYCQYPQSGCQNTNIQGFGPKSLNADIGRFSDSFSSYSETPLSPYGLTSISATIGNGSIVFVLENNYTFIGNIYSGSMDGYYCKRAPFDNCGQHVNGLVEITAYFSGKWMIPHYPAPEFWPAQGHFYVAEQDAYDTWGNCNLTGNGCGKPPSTIWIDTQVPGTTPEPNTLVLLGSGILGLAGMIRRKLTR